MSETYASPVLASYRDAVTELMRAGEPFSQVEVVIDDIVYLSEDAKAALWLLAFSLRERADQVRDAHACVAALA